MTLSIAHKHLRSLLNDFDNVDVEDVMLELQFSSLIVAFNRSTGFPIIDSKFIPLFTDRHELRKFDPDGEYQYADEEYNYYLEMLYKLDHSGFIINPCSESIEVSGKLLRPNCHFQFDYEPYTVKEIRQLKAIKNREFNDFLQNKDNLWDKETLIDKLSKSTPYVLLISDENLDNHAEDGVITKSLAGGIPKCVYELSTSNCLLLFSREINPDCVDYDGFKYAEIANFHQTVDEILSFDFDGLILNIDEENITVPRESLRDFMKGFRCPLIDDYSGYAFTIGRWNSMWRLFLKEFRTMLAILLVIIITQSLFFIAYSYIMSGDPYLALDNFYGIMYNH